LFLNQNLKVLPQVDGLVILYIDSVIHPRGESNIYIIAQIGQNVKGVSLTLPISLQDPAACTFEVYHGPDRREIHSPTREAVPYASLVPGGGQRELESLLDIGRLGVEEGGEGLEFRGKVAFNQYLLLCNLRGVRHTWLGISS